MADKQQVEQLAHLVDAAYAALKAAQTYANITKQTFRFTPAYGMGGTFYPDSVQNDEDSWAPSDTDDGWYSSSMGC